jgi:hypothetical protein
MFIVYRENNVGHFLTNPHTKTNIFFDIETLQTVVEDDARRDLYEDGDSILYVLVDLKNKTFKTLRVDYILTYATEFYIED